MHQVNNAQYRFITLWQIKQPFAQIEFNCAESGECNANGKNGKRDQYSKQYVD